jgi:hypothetical protein
MGEQGPGSTSRPLSYPDRCPIVVRMMGMSFAAVVMIVASIVLLFAFAFWVQFMIRYNVRMHAVVTRFMRPGETLSAWEYAELALLPIRDPTRLSARVTPQGSDHLQACATLRRHIWQAIAVFLLAAAVMWLARS